MIKGIMFDKDGTLLDYKAFWFKVAENAIDKLLKRYEIENTSAEAVMRALGAYDGITSLFYYGTYQDFADKFNENVGKMVATREETAKLFRECADFGEIIPATDKLVEVFKSLKEMGIKTAVVTTDEPNMTRHCLEELGISGYIDDIYADDGINPTKPDPYYMNCFSEKYRISNNEIIMVGDTLLDMAFAKNGGAYGIGVAKETRDKEILSKKADIVLNDVSELIAFLGRLEK